MTSSSQTYRLQNPARAAWLVMVMLGWFSCGPHGTPILITLAGDLTDVESIELTPVLNGHPGQVITHDPAEKQRVLWIPESESGQLQIEADGKSRGADDCKPAHASASVAFRPDFSKPTEVELNFKPAQCLLTVQLHGVASVTSQPEGLDCPVGATVCKGWFARGQAVNLNAGSRSSSSCLLRIEPACTYSMLVCRRWRT